MVQLYSFRIDYKGKGLVFVVDVTRGSYQKFIKDIWKSSGAFLMSPQISATPYVFCND